MKRINKQRSILSILMILTLVISFLGTGLTSAKADSSTSSVIITESGGWLEAAYAKWSPVSNATGYNVYYKNASTADSAYMQIDTELIRQYSTYIRADVLGLAAGDYVIKIVPVIDGAESTSMAAITDVLTVSAHTREGFGFSSLSVMGTSSGGYNDDGTLPTNAQILYITADTANTVTLDVITSSSGKTTSYTGLANILTGRQKGYDKTPLIIRLIGKIEASNISGLNSNGYLQVKGCYNVTIEGVGDDATVYGWGLLVRSATNVEIRNLGLMLFPDDGISLDTANENIWVHNNDIFYGSAGSDADQVKGDGSCDVKGLSTYVTISYNHFWDSGKSSLCGMSDSEEFFVTYHHNWYDHSDSRHPRIRVGTIHIYNNFFDGNSKYGVGVTKGSSAFVEANYFRNCKYPMLISLQGTDVYGDSEGTFSGEAGGMIKAYNNTVVGATRLVYQTEDAIEFDAVLVTSREEQVSSSYSTVSGGNTYNNFDTSSSMYSYQPHAPENVEEIVTTYSGRMNGGDFNWEFDDSVDDTSYDVNTELMAKIKGYTSYLVSVGGNSIASVTPTATPTATPTVTPAATPTAIPTSTPTTTLTPTSLEEASYVHNFTESGLSSSFFTISGNLSTTKGTVTYNGLTLTSCLKIETSTSISFTTTATSELTLVFNSSNSSNIKIDGTTYTLNNGIVTVQLAAGSHTITKASTGNLYYMSLTISGATPTVTPTVAPTATPTATPTVAPTATPAVTPTATPTVAPVEGDAIYVSPNGGGNGTQDSPTNITAAITAVQPGGTIYCMEGTYYNSKQLTIAAGNDGSEGKYKTIRPYDNAKVVFDFSSQVYGDTNTNLRGIKLDGNYWHIYGIEVTGAADNGVFLSGKYNIIEMCKIYANRDSGLQISRATSSLSDMADWPAYNLIKNCTSFNNMDPATGENADGFAAKLTCGEGNVFDGCISYNNVDDGWDLYAKSETGPIGVVTIKNCIAFRNGSTSDGTFTDNSDGNGFKLGGSGVGTPHVITNCIAFENKNHGFTDNNNPTAISISNCTSFNNSRADGGKANFQCNRAASGATYENCISFSTNTIGSDKFVGTISNSLYFNSSKYYFVTSATKINSDKVGTVVSTPTASDFASIESPILGADVHSLWRNADGSINVGTFLQITNSNYSGMGANLN